MLFVFVFVVISIMLVILGAIIYIINSLGEYVLSYHKNQLLFKHLK